MEEGSPFDWAGMYARAFFERQRKQQRRGTKRRICAAAFLIPTLLGLASVGLWYLLVGRFAPRVGSHLAAGAPRLRFPWQARDGASTPGEGLAQSHDHSRAAEEVGLLDDGAGAHSEHEHGSAPHEHAPRLVVVTSEARAEHDHAHGHSHAKSEAGSVPSPLPGSQSAARDLRSQNSASDSTAATTAGAAASANPVSMSESAAPPSATAAKVGVGTSQSSGAPGGEPPSTRAAVVTAAVPTPPLTAAAAAAGVISAAETPATPAAVTAAAYTLPVHAAPVPRDKSWVPPQRPDPAFPTATVTGPKWEAAERVASMNPPQPLESLADPAASAELSSRLVIAIGLGVHSGRTNVPAEGLGSLSLFRNLLASFFPSAQSHFIYRLYFAFDTGDAIFESPDWRAKVEASIEEMRRVEEAKRWHPPDYIAGRTLDHSTLVVSVHWVRCGYSGKPSWAHSDAISAAYREGADYAMRTNDDTSFPTKGDWADAFILDLRSRSPVPNLGVVGPACGAGANWILTHDFTHKTHVAIFGLHYPRSLPDWSADDWITIVYRQFKAMVRREDYHVEHHLFPSRYKETNQATRLANLNAALKSGADDIDAWVSATHNGLSLPHSIETVTCC